MCDTSVIETAYQTTGDTSVKGNAFHTTGDISVIGIEVVPITLVSHVVW
jgi:hypothetical protein